MNLMNLPKTRVLSLAGLMLSLWAALAPDAAARERWSPEEARRWDERTPWLVGANYVPAYAVNQLEMWQADTFDPRAIDRELGWAEDLGFTSVRVFLHHLLWEQDREGFLRRMEQFLEIADRRDLGVMFVLFDSVWDPHPKLGRQRAPQPGVHNSGWVQSPGADELKDTDRHALLEEYVRGVVGRFKDDRRVQVWDVWNEPDNMNDNSYGRNKLKEELPAEEKHRLVERLLEDTFEWARAEDPVQPLTSGLWLGGHKADPVRLIPIERVQLEQSDVISFHSYGRLPDVQAWVAALQKHGRPLLCTEYMARPLGSTFDPVLAYFKDEGIAAYNWGFVAGKSQTIYPWDSWQKPYAKEPEVWFHDIFRTDGTPYDRREVEFIRRLTGAASE
jgi:hypothetical protein